MCIRDRRDPFNVLAPKNSARGRRFADVRQASEAAHEAVREAARAHEAAVAREAELAEEQTVLLTRRVTYDHAQSDLAAHNAELFESSDGIFPAVDALRTEDAVLREMRALVPIETERERRARSALESAEREIRDVLRMVQRCMRILMEIGLGENRKNKRELVTGGLPRAIQRIEPILLRVKTVIGDYYTKVALARQRQPEILPSVLVHVGDLSVILGRRKDAPPNEELFVATVETAYGQCRAACAYVEQEISVSRARSAALRRRELELHDEIHAATQRTIHGEACAVATLADALGHYGPAEHVAAGGAGSDALVAAVREADAAVRARFPLERDPLELPDAPAGARPLSRDVYPASAASSVTAARSVQRSARSTTTDSKTFVPSLISGMSMSVDNSTAIGRAARARLHALIVDVHSCLLYTSPSPRD